MEVASSWDGILTLAAPLVAIIMALTTRQVVISLLMGTAAAALVASHGQLLPHGVLHEVSCAVAATKCSDGGAISNLVFYVSGAFSDTNHLTISVFTMFVAAMIGVMFESGATKTMVRFLEQRAKGPQSTMFAAWFAGMVVFFDDYANCLVVGKSMGPMCDRNQVSRQKLAYIVDSTAAPVASLALIGTWVGYEVGLIDQALTEVGRGGEGFELFLYALPYRFYSLFALALVGILIWRQKDYGPMLRVEQRARQAPPTRTDLEDRIILEPRDGIMAALPVLTLVGVPFLLMFWQGVTALEGSLLYARPHEILAGADPYYAMFAGSLYAFLLASYLGFDNGSLNGERWADGTAKGIKTVLRALGVLYAAWALGAGISDAGTAVFLRDILSSTLSAHWIPTVVFALAAMTAFSTGTSFGTMSILLPLAVPLAAGYAGAPDSVLPATTAAVLAGACLGDHASPISDTTVLAAAGSQADLVTHVRTQLPYALTAGLVAVFFGYLPAGIGIPAIVCLPFGFLALYAVVERLGQDPSVVVAEVDAELDPDLIAALKRQGAIAKMEREKRLASVVDDVAVARLRMGIDLGKPKHEMTDEDRADYLGTEARDPATLQASAIHFTDTSSTDGMEDAEPEGALAEASDTEPTPVVSTAGATGVPTPASMDVVDDLVDEETEDTGETVVVAKTDWRDAGDTPRQAATRRVFKVGSGGTAASALDAVEAAAWAPAEAVEASDGPAEDTGQADAPAAETWSEEAAWDAGEGTMWAEIQGSHEAEAAWSPTDGDASWEEDASQEMDSEAWRAGGDQDGDWEADSQAGSWEGQASDTWHDDPDDDWDGDAFTDSEPQPELDADIEPDERSVAWRVLPAGGWSKTSPVPWGGVPTKAARSKRGAKTRTREEPPPSE